MNKIEITVLSARVLDALSGRGLKAKTVHEFERYGTRRIVKHCLGKGQILYSKETVQNFVWQERAKQESGTLPHYQWGITRRAAVYLDQMAEYGKMLAYTTGLRGCDIVNLKFDSIDWDACELRLVQEKTNIPVSLPLDTKTGNAIADYILHARPKCKSEYIFLRVLRPYTKIGSMWTVIAKYAHIALGKDRKMNGPHAFRRGMGRQLLEANIPAPLICDILGHSSSVSLRQYTASSLEKLKVCAGTISAIPIAQEALL